METLKFGRHTFRINECKGVNEMVYNMLKQVDPIFDLSNNDFRCITCGDEIEHNYGTDEYPQCILCGNENSDNNIIL